MLITLKREAGLTLIEVLVALAIFSVLMVVGVTDFREWVQNTQIRTVAESIQAGLQFSRSEAVKRNEPVQIVFNANYRGWTIQLVSNMSTLRQENGLDGYSNISVAPASNLFQPANSFASLNTVTFTGLGRISRLNADSSSPFGSLSIDNSAMDSDISRDLNIVLSTVGNIRLCDPNKNAPDPRACL